MNSNTHDSQPVKLKGVGDSLWVTFDPLMSEEHLCEEMGKLFERMKHLAKNARVVLDPGVEKGHDALVEKLGQFLKRSFQVGSVGKPSEKRSKPVERTRQRDVSRSWQQHSSNALVLSGRIRSGQKIESKKNLIILGDVNPGAEVIAGGDVIIMGNLSGLASAGSPDNKDSIIIALNFCPTQVQIGGCVAAGLAGPSGKGAEYAHVVDGLIVVEDYLAAAPFGREPWPKQR